jgi:hypothetical protein
MKKILLWTLFFIWACCTIVFAAAPTRTSTYVSGDAILANDVTGNEDSIFNYLQGGVDVIKDGSIVNADINGSANIQSDKLNLTAVVQNIANTGTLSNTGNVTVTGNQTITGYIAATGTINTAGLYDNGSELIPQGAIILWSGTIASIPSGWELCDGTCSITCPDLTNRFIVGADADDGGVAKSTITGSALASHDTGVMPAHTHTKTMYQVSGTGSGLGQTGLTSSAQTMTTDSSGTGTKVIPVFYSLAYIIKN